MDEFRENNKPISSFKELAEAAKNFRKIKKPDFIEGCTSEIAFLNLLDNLNKHTDEKYKYYVQFKTKRNGENIYCYMTHFFELAFKMLEESNFHRFKSVITSRKSYLQKVDKILFELENTLKKIYNEENRSKQFKLNFANSANNVINSQQNQLKTEQEAKDIVRKSIKFANIQFIIEHSKESLSKIVEITEIKVLEIKSSLDRNIDLLESLSSFGFENSYSAKNILKNDDNIDELNKESGKEPKKSEVDLINLSEIIINEKQVEYNQINKENERIKKKKHSKSKKNNSIDDANRENVRLKPKENEEQNILIEISNDKLKRFEESLKRKILYIKNRAIGNNHSENQEFSENFFSVFTKNKINLDILKIQELHKQRKEKLRENNNLVNHKFTYFNWKYRKK